MTEKKINPQPIPKKGGSAVEEALKMGIDPKKKKKEITAGEVMGERAGRHGNKR